MWIGFQAAGRMQSRGLDKGQAQMPKVWQPSTADPSLLCIHIPSIWLRPRRLFDLMLFPSRTRALAVAPDCQGGVGGRAEEHRVTLTVTHS